MTAKPNDIRMFFAYHIRSSFLAYEAVLYEQCADWNLSIDEFYVLRSDWKAAGISGAEISAHAMKTQDEVQKLLKELIAKDYVMKNAKNDIYALTSQGVIIREKALREYQEHFSDVTKGLYEEAVETALSALLTVQNNIRSS